jgi:hypothetical protein
VDSKIRKKIKDLRIANQITTSPSTRIVALKVNQFYKKIRLDNNDFTPLKVKCSLKKLNQALSFRLFLQPDEKENIP